MEYIFHSLVIGMIGLFLWHNSRLRDLEDKYRSLELRMSSIDKKLDQLLALVTDIKEGRTNV